MLVFSQWASQLQIVAHALTENEIEFLSFDSGKGKKRWDAALKFREDPRVNVFLLHGKSQSAGLTLTAATHVFLLEPQLNVSIELQSKILCFYRFYIYF